MSKIRRAAAVLTLALGATGGVALASTAMATGNHGGCATKTVVTHLVDRPDSGVKGNNWAKDKFTRTVKLCTRGPAVAGLQPYHADVTDLGEFVTVAGHSPNGTAEVPAGVKGVMWGGFTADFAAAADWKTFDASKLQGKTFTGAAGSATGGPSSGSWVSSLFGAEFKGSGLNKGWRWTYETCKGQRGGQKWVNADAGNHGDITKLCRCQPPTKPPTTPPTATPTVTAPPTKPPTVPPTTQPTATRPPTTPPAAPGGGGGDSYTNGGLAQTGFPVTTVSGVGVAVLAAGALVVFLVRRRRTSFEA